MEDITTSERRRFTRLLKQSLGGCKVEVLWHRNPIKYTQSGVTYTKCKFRYSNDNYERCYEAIMTAKAGSTSMKVNAPQ